MAEAFDDEGAFGTPKSEAGSVSELEFAPLRGGSLAEEVADKIYAAVVERRIKPGERLSEAALARSFGISRGPIREAQRLLEHRGLLSFKSRRGFFVRKLSIREVEDLFDFREHIERYAISLAVKRASDTELSRLERWRVPLFEAAKPVDASLLVEQDLALHRLICELAQNASLMTVYEPILTQLRLALSMINVGLRVPGNLVTLHDELIDSLLARDVPRAHEALNAHLRSSLGKLLARLDKQGEYVETSSREGEGRDEA